MEFLFRWWKINSCNPENIATCLKVANVMGKVEGLEGPEVSGAGEAGVVQS